MAVSGITYDIPVSVVLACSRNDARARRGRVVTQLAEWNRTLDEAGRYEAVMGAEGLIKVRLLTKRLPSRTPRKETNTGQPKGPLRSDW